MINEAKDYLDHFFDVFFQQELLDGSRRITIKPEQVPKYQDLADQAVDWFTSLGLETCRVLFVTDLDQVSETIGHNEAREKIEEYTSVGKFLHKRVQLAVAVDYRFISYIAYQIIKDVPKKLLSSVIHVIHNEYQGKESTIWPHMMFRIGTVQTAINTLGDQFPDVYDTHDTPARRVWSDFFMPFCEKEGIPDLIIPMHILQNKNDLQDAL